jgi:hypothetical protein
MELDQPFLFSIRSSRGFLGESVLKSLDAAMEKVGVGEPYKRFRVSGKSYHLFNNCPPLLLPLKFSRCGSSRAICKVRALESMHSVFGWSLLLQRCGKELEVTLREPIAFPNLTATSSATVTSRPFARAKGIASRWKTPFRSASTAAGMESRQGASSGASSPAARPEAVTASSRGFAASMCLRSLCMRRSVSCPSEPCLRRAKSSANG